jgi:hypothetical protein
MVRDFESSGFAEFPCESDHGQPAGRRVGTNLQIGPEKNGNRGKRDVKDDGKVIGFV